MLTVLRRWLKNWANVSSSKDADIDFRMLAEQNNDVIFLCGKDGTTSYVSPAAERVFGWTPEEMLGKGPAAFVLPEDVPRIMAAQMDHLEGDETSLVSYRVRRKDGAVVWVEASARLLREGASRNHHIMVVMRDISERKHLEEQLSRMALTDGLTGLANRRAFDDALEREWARTMQGQLQLSLLLIDLDNFKGFNDHYGHQVGDDCLRSVAEALRTGLRPGDLIARYGGEELGVILPKTGAQDAVVIADDMRVRVRNLGIPHAANTQAGCAVTISVGAATAFPRVGASVQMPAGLLQAADVALYKAKNNGRDRVETGLLLSAEASPPGVTTR